MNENLLDVCETQFGVNMDRVRIDYAAMDTLSNFTTLADDVKAGNFKSVAILTSKNHVGCPSCSSAVCSFKSEMIYGSC